MIQMTSEEAQKNGQWRRLFQEEIIPCNTEEQLTSEHVNLVFSSILLFFQACVQLMLCHCEGMGKQNKIV